MSKKQVIIETQKSNKTQNKNESYYTGIGRRREAVARVKLMINPNEQIFSVNDLPVEKYFSSELAKQIYTEPFRTTNTLNRFSVIVKVKGSGKQGQLGAVVHGIARALLKVDMDKYHTILRRKGFLTRDSRTRERRKVGRGGKARRQKQSPKR